MTMNRPGDREDGGGPSPDPTIRLVPVFETEDYGVAAVAKSLLDDAGIDYSVSGEILRNFVGWGSPGVYGVRPAVFVVREEDAARTRELLAQLAPRDE